MINKKNNYLVILIATYNRLDLLKMVIDSIERETRCPHEIIVIDGGSTDGTREFLQNHLKVTPVFQGTLLGGSRAYNHVWREIDCKYTCWLSDDTEVVNGSLDLAVSILEKDSSIGMVGLKMKDVEGPAKYLPYKGALSIYGILNCNHGVLSYQLLTDVGFFNESYRSYNLDPDLTASILSIGKRVVLTKKISVLHYREWALLPNANTKMSDEMGGIDNARVYRDKFQYMDFPKVIIRAFFYDIIRHRLLKRYNKFEYLRNKLLDLANIVGSSTMKMRIEIFQRNRNYHLIQQIPVRRLNDEKNPYFSIVSKKMVLERNKQLK